MGFCGDAECRDRERGANSCCRLVTALAMTGAWICGGYWYVHFYPAEKTLILAGPWPFAHNVFMEVKEHLFFIAGILAFLLPVATRENLPVNNAAVNWCFRFPG